MALRLLLAACAALALTVPAQAELTEDEAAAFAATAWRIHSGQLREETEAEMAAQAIEADGYTLKFRTLSFEGGEGTQCVAPCAADDGRARPLFISMHGGGGVAPELNDQQWANQVKLGHTYAPQEGIYLAPRAPTNEWNCWHRAEVDVLLARLIAAFVAAGTADPDRIYLMGYSAGGDGVYALSPRMANRLAAAAMMAGHPNGISLAGLRNLPFTIHMGANDSAYNRNTVAMQYGEMLDAMQADDRGGYVHETVIHPGKGHWMDNEDRVAVPWMEQFTRETAPNRVVWPLQGVIPRTFYWLGLKDGGTMGEVIIGSIHEQTIVVEGPSGRAVEVWLNDALVDLDQPIVILTPGGDTLFEGVLPRTRDTISLSIVLRNDPAMVFTAKADVVLP
jgi:poly(3-hydroxybutyrate) depolymerase